MNWLLNKLRDFYNPTTFRAKITELSSNEICNAAEALSGAPHKTILYVLPTVEHARWRAAEMGYPLNMQFAGIGMVLCGYGFDEIIVDMDWILSDENKSKAFQAKAEDYIEQIRTRLMLGGRMRYIQ